MQMAAITGNVQSIQRRVTLLSAIKIHIIAALLNSNLISKVGKR